MSKSFSKTISVVVPCYNEKEVVELFLVKIHEVIKQCAYNFEIIFINDGSSDSTLSQLRLLKNTYPHIRIINLSRNFGKEAAMTAGLDAATGDALIPIDADLQDPPELILTLIEKWESGFDVVLAKRTDRSSDSFSKRFTSELFYKFHNKISDVKIPDNVGDYRLMSRRVYESIKELGENQRFMKGILSWVGFNTTTVEYTRQIREAGKSSFNGWKLWNLALEGITSFSTVPLRMWLYFGFIIASLSVFFGGWIIVKTLIFGVDTPGYASLVTIALFLGGVQLMGIGILGEYIGRMYMETKKRPIYIVENEY